MDEQSHLSFPLRICTGAIGTAAAPVLVDARHSGAFAADKPHDVGAIRRNPDDVQNWCQELPSGRAVVDGVHGHEASQEAASAPRGAGLNASYLEHGIAGWAEYQLPMRSSSTGSYQAGVASGRERSACGGRIDSDTHRDP